MEAPYRQVMAYQQKSNPTAAPAESISAQLCWLPALGQSCALLPKPLPLLPSSFLLSNSSHLFLLFLLLIILFLVLLFPLLMFLFTMTQA